MAEKTATILIGHGSLVSDSGKGMIAIATALRTAGVTPIVEAAFLNYSRPTLAETMQACYAQGATKVIIQPYFLIAGHYVQNDLPTLVRTVADDYRTVPFTIAEALCAHPALVKLALKRIQAVDPAPSAQSALLFVAHGTPLAEANGPITQVLAQVQRKGGYCHSGIGYLDCNEPDIPSAIDAMVARAIDRLVILPYFLHLGRHVRKDLPALFTAAQQRHPHVELRVAHYLDNDPLLVTVTAERIMSVLRC